jgi:hypothetical protein
VGCGDETVSAQHIPPGLEAQVAAAFHALAEGRGLEQPHLATIQYCMSTCNEGFLEAYENYFLFQQGDIYEINV